MTGQKYYRGQVYYIDSEGGGYTGCEQGGERPAVIVSNDVGNGYSSIVEVVFLSTKKKKPLPTHVEINSAKRPSIALCEQIQTVSQERIGSYISEVTQSELQRIEKALLISLDISTDERRTK